MVHKKTKHLKTKIIDSFVIPKETIEEMNELNHKTHQTGKEHGMALCLSPQKKIVPGKTSVGNEYSIYIPETCKNKEDLYYGSFHTHPRPSETKFSAMDLFSSCDKNSKIDCIGMNKHGEVECFVKKNKNKSCQEEVRPLVDIENTYQWISPKDRDVVKDALLDAVDNITDDKFKSKKIL